MFNIFIKTNAVKHCNVNNKPRLFNFPNEPKQNNRKICKYRPYVSRDEDDDGEGAEPSICNGEEHIFGYIGSREISQWKNHQGNS